LPDPSRQVPAVQGSDGAAGPDQVVEYVAQGLRSHLAPLPQFLEVHRTTKGTQHLQDAFL
jgi:hypothetical protein